MISADDALRRYLSVKSQLVVPRSTNPRAIEGYLYAARCGNCGRVACWTEREETKRKGRRVVCRYCQAAWHRIEAWIPPGVIGARIRPSRSSGGPKQPPKPHVASTGSRVRPRYMGDRKLVELCTLERILFRPPRRGQRVAGRKLRSYAGAPYWRFALSNWVNQLAIGLSVTQIAQLGSLRYPEEAWSEKRVQRSITFARQVVEERLERIERAEERVA